MIYRNPLSRLSELCKCSSVNVAERKRKKDKPRAYRCRDCRNDFFREDGNSNAQVPAWISDLGGCHLSVSYESERGIQYEASREFGDNVKELLAFGTSYQGIMKR